MMQHHMSLYDEKFCFTFLNRWKMYNNHQLQTLFWPSEHLIRRRRSTGFSALEPRSSKSRIHESFLWYQKRKINQKPGLHKLPKSENVGKMDWSGYGNYLVLTRNLLRRCANITLGRWPEKTSSSTRMEKDIQAYQQGEVLQAHESH